MNELQKRDALRLSNDEAQRLSRDCLEASLFRLMGKKAFDCISISEIVQTAGVSRNAFYRNYKTKEALLSSLCNTIIDKLKHFLPLLDETDAAAYTHFFKMILANANVFRILLNVRASLADKLMGTANDYSLIAKEGAFTQIIIYWFETGMKKSPDEMGTICEKILSSIPHD